MTTLERRDSQAGLGDRGGSPSEDELWRQAYAELRCLAARRIARLAPGRSLHPTLLVNEVFLRLQGHGQGRWRDRSHLIAVAARAMRFAVIDHLRTGLRQKRGGGHRPIHESQANLGRTDRRFELLDLEHALNRLEAYHFRAAEVVTLRFYAGLTTDETAELLGTSTATVERDWRFARAWLKRELATSSGAGPSGGWPR